MLGGVSGLQALEEAVERSWALLDGAERESLVACAMFRGRFQAAHAAALLPAATLDRLQSLQRAGLLAANAARAAANARQTTG
mgnify:CR=1 FL=1